jgi:hypothetical protein
MPPQNGPANIIKIIVPILLFLVLATGAAVFYFKNTPTDTNSPSLENTTPTIAPLSKGKERDFQRMIDIQRLRASLETYHDQCNGYPPMPRIAVFGSPLLDASFNAGCPKGTSFGTINGPIPVNPMPGGVNYQYCSEGTPGSGKCGISAKGKAEGYLLTFRLEENIDSALSSGVHTATPKGIK